MDNDKTSVLLIAYDINDENRRSRVVDRIRRQVHVKLSESVYAIDTTLSPSAVFNKLIELIGEEDTLHVITQIRPFAGTQDDAIVWLEDHLPEEPEEPDDQGDPETEV